VQEDNKFFRYVWRVDAVLLAMAGLAVVVLVTWELVANLLRPGYEPVPEGNFRPVPKDAEQNYTYRLEDQGGAASLPHEKILALRRWKGAPASYGLAKSRVLEESSAYISAEHSYVDVVNLLLIDTVSGTSRWLFNGYKRLVSSQEIIYAGGPRSWAVEPSQNQPIALVIHSVDADTNNDGEFDSKDDQSLYYLRPNDSRAVKFFSAKYMLSTGETDRGDYLVVYEKGRSAFAATFRVPDFKLKSLKQLPAVPP
jgi:hypothetical protein